MRNGYLKTFKYVLIIGLFVAVGAAVLIHVRYKSYGKYEGFAYGTVVETSDMADLYNNDGRLFVTTMNGTRGYDGDCKLLMDVAFELDHPITVSCGNVAAIADIGGTKVYVIASNGIPHNYKTDSPIVKLCVASDGTTAVLLDNGTKDMIRIYDPEGELKVEIGTTTDVDGFPVDIALSDDGMKLATLYLSFEGDDIRSKVTFYNTGDVGKNFIENIVGQKIYAREMAYSVDFMGKDHVAVVFGNGFSIFSMVEVPSLTLNERREEKILDVAVCDECVAIVSEEEAGNVLSFYNTKGVACGRITNIGNYESLTVSNGEALLVKGSTAVIYRMNGTVKVECPLEGGGDRIFSGSGNKYFITDSDKIRSASLVK